MYLRTHETNKPDPTIAPTRYDTTVLIYVMKLIIQSRGCDLAVSYSVVGCISKLQISPSTSIIQQ